MLRMRYAYATHTLRIRINGFLLLYQFVRDTDTWVQSEYSKNSLNRPTRGPDSNGPCREVVDLGSLNTTMDHRLGPK